MEGKVKETKVTIRESKKTLSKLCFCEDVFLSINKQGDAVIRIPWQKTADFILNHS